MTEARTGIRDGVSAVDRRRQIIAASVVLLVAAGIVTWWALRPPTAPTVLGERTVVGFDADPRPVKAAAGFAGLALPRAEDDEVLTFRGAPKVHFRTNTAAATARVAVCVLGAGQDTFIAGYARDLGTACREVRYVEDGTHVRWGGSGDDPLEYLILVVTPSRAGVATVDRVTYDYERESGERGLDVADSVDYTIRAS
ncbi:hypothetical protein [Nocardioides sp.]|uniref:hypothetical protein n=1 Tax=Nocardioides sp. TaxID=35761 RepID=UPI003784026E